MNDTVIILNFEKLMYDIYGNSFEHETTVGPIYRIILVHLFSKIM